MGKHWGKAISLGAATLLLILNLPWLSGPVSSVMDRLMQELAIRATPLNIALLVLMAMPWFVDGIAEQAARALHLVARMSPVNRARLLITPAALTLLTVDLVRRGFVLDLTPLLLFVMAILPWMTDLILSAKLPGGVEIAFKDIANAEEVAGAVSAPERRRGNLFDDWQSTDPRLALVALRIEIERRIRELARRTSRPHSGSLHALIQNLGEARVLSAKFVPGLLELVNAGNAAAHGAEISPAVNDWAYSRGAAVLARLDAELHRQKSSR